MIQLTNHARIRMREMRLGIEDILAVLNNPDVEYDQTHKGRKQRMAQKGDIAVAYVREGDIRLVVTVLWRTQEQYRRKWKIGQ